MKSTHACDRVLIGCAMLVVLAVPLRGWGQQTMFAGYDAFCGLPVVVGIDPQGASARTDHLGQKFIHVDQYVMVNWTASRMFALAHECAHHILGHTTALGTLQRYMGGPSRQELEADCWAAQALRRVGHDFEITRTVLDRANEGHFSSAGYPTGSQRAAEILRCAASEVDPYVNVYDDGEVWISDSDVDWNRNPATPVVRYMIEVTNDEDGRVQCTVTVNQILISRTSAEPIRVFRTESHSLNIPTAGVRTINASMMWYADGDVYPGLRWRLRCS